MKTIKEGDNIFFEIDGCFEKDVAKEVVEVDGHILITPEYYDWLVLTEKDLLDDTDKRVQEEKALESKKLVSLDEVRSWLSYNAYNYYESDTWSSFDKDKMIRDLCVAMVYSNR